MFADIKKPLSLGCQRGMLRKVMRPFDGTQYIRELQPTGAILVIDEYCSTAKWKRYSFDR